MKELKFFVDCHVFDGSPQGTTTYIKGLYQELIKDKTKTFYFASYNENLKNVFGEYDNVKYLKYSTKNKFIRLLIEIPRLIKKYKIDYAHFQYIVPPIKLCKYIVTIHDVLFLDFPTYFPIAYKISKKNLFRWSAKHSDIVLTVSEYSKNKIQTHFNIQNIAITPNAVNPVFFDEYNKKQMIETVKIKYNIENYFLFVSRWEPRKNHHLLLKVFVENKYYDNYFLVFVGDKAITNTVYINYYETLIEEIKNKVIILNKVDSDELLVLMRGATLSVYPSIAEGFGIPPLEAAAARVPSICSNTTSMSDFDFLRNGLFNPFDEKDLTEKIEFGLNQQNVKDISEIIKHKYDWKLAATSLLKAIDQDLLNSINE